MDNSLNLAELGSARRQSDFQFSLPGDIRTQINRLSPSFLQLSYKRIALCRRLGPAYQNQPGTICFGQIPGKNSSQTTETTRDEVDPGFLDRERRDRIRYKNFRPLAHTLAANIANLDVTILTSQ